MIESRLLRVALVVSGTVLSFAGAYTFFSPVGFFEMNGAVLADDVNALNFARATGGLLLACGLLILSGLFIKRLTYTSSLLGAVVFLSYGFGRATSFLVDGVPSSELIRATGLEIAVGTLALVAFLKIREK